MEVQATTVEPAGWHTAKTAGTQPPPPYATCPLLDHLLILPRLSLTPRERGPTHGIAFLVLATAAILPQSLLSFSTSSGVYSAGRADLTLNVTDGQFPLRVHAFATPACDACSQSPHFTHLLMRRPSCICDTLLRRFTHACAAWRSFGGAYTGRSVSSGRHGWRATPAGSHRRAGWRRRRYVLVPACPPHLDASAYLPLNMPSPPSTRAARCTIAPDIARAAADDSAGRTRHHAPPVTLRFAAQHTRGRGMCGFSFKTRHPARCCAPALHTHRTCLRTHTPRHCAPAHAFTALPPLWLNAAYSTPRTHCCACLTFCHTCAHHTLPTT